MGEPSADNDVPVSPFPVWAKCPTCGLKMLLRKDGKCRNPNCADYGGPKPTRVTPPEGTSDE